MKFLHILKLASGTLKGWYHEPDYISEEDLPFFVKDKSCCSYQVESGRRFCVSALCDVVTYDARGVDLLNFDTVQKKVSPLKSKVSSSKSITDKHYSYERLLNRRAGEGWQLFSVVSLNSNTTEELLMMSTSFLLFSDQSCGRQMTCN